jgi:hypothetical protein
MQKLLRLLKFLLNKQPGELQNTPQTLSTGSTHQGASKLKRCSAVLQLNYIAKEYLNKVDPSWKGHRRENKIQLDQYMGQLSNGFKSWEALSRTKPPALLQVPN